MTSRTRTGQPLAIRVYFNYQEDDQGDHWSPKPTAIEEQSYQKMLKRFSYTGPGRSRPATSMRQIAPVGKRWRGGLARWGERRRRKPYKLKVPTAEIEHGF